MIWFVNYLKLQLKKAGKAFPPVFLMTLILSVGFGGLLWIQYQQQGADSSLQKVKVGVVGDFEDNYLSIGLTALETFDSTRFTLELVQLTDEAEARRELEAGQLSAYILIPDEFITSVFTGENAKITYVTGSNQGGIAVQLIQEVAEAVSVMITETQTGIYAMEDYASAQGETGQILYDDVLSLNIAYLNQVLSRDEIYQVETTLGPDAVSTAGYYTCAVLLVFLLLWGMNGGPLLVREDLSLEKMLRAGGFPSWAQSLCEFLAYLCLMAVNVTLIFLLVAGILPLSGLTISELSGWGEFVSFFAAAWPVLICVAAMQFLLYTLSNSLIDGLLLNFIGALALGYLSGCFYPLAYFPKIIQQIAAVLPTGMGMEYLQDCLQGTSPSSLAGLLAWSALFLILAIGVRIEKIRRY